MKILLFGASGQLGWELQRALAPLGDVVALTSASGPLHSDFREPDRLTQTVQAVRPDVIVNAAAYTAVDRAESDSDTAYRINAIAPAVLARCARAAGACLVHYSTDYVFDGSGNTPRDEASPTGPLNVYGASKLQGELEVARHCEQYLVLRTSWVYAGRGGNFARTMLRLAKERERLSVVDDQVGAPTGADLLADVTVHALRAVLADPGKAGLYHATAAGETSWNGYARFLLQAACASGFALKVSPDQVEAVPSSAYPTPARRPLNSRLDCRRLEAEFGLQLPHWTFGVTRMLAEMQVTPAHGLG